jgi:hypothetical protein
LLGDTKACQVQFVVFTESSIESEAKLKGDETEDNDDEGKLFACILVFVLATTFHHDDVL